MQIATEVRYQNTKSTNNLRSSKRRCNNNENAASRFPFYARKARTILHPINIRMNAHEKEGGEGGRAKEREKEMEENLPVYRCIRFLLVPNN